MAFSMFLSHVQVSGGDACYAMASALSDAGVATWYDQTFSGELNAETMKAGVKNSNLFVLFVSDGLFKSNVVLDVELQTAIEAKKPVIALVDGDYPGNWQEDVPLRFREALLKQATPVRFARFGAERLSMLSLLAEKAGASDDSVTKLKEAFSSNLISESISDEPCEVCVLCDLAADSDKASVLATALSRHGINAKIGFRVKAKKYLLFVSDATFKNPNVNAVLREAISSNAKVSAIYESNPMRGGVVHNGSELDAGRLLRECADDDVLGKLLSSVEFLPYKRRGPELKTLINLVVRRGELILPVDLSVPGSFDPYELPVRKAKALAIGTRGWIFDDVRNKVMKEQTNAYVLLAGPGVGKSVVMGEIAARGNTFVQQRMGGIRGTDSSNVTVAAMHFFLFSDDVAKSGSIALRSIAMQLSSSLDGFQNHLPSQSRVEECGSSLSELLSAVVVDPLVALNVEATTPLPRIAILIDAIDECADAEGFAVAIQSEWPRAPDFVSLIASSRPGASIAKAVGAFAPRSLEPTSNDNMRDVNEFLDRRLDFLGVSKKEKSALLPELASRSGGVFLWLQMVDESLQTLAANDQLDLAHVKNAVPNGLSEVYARDFKHVLEDAFNGDGESFRRCLAPLLVAREPLPISTWRTASGFRSDCMYDEEFSRTVLEALSKVLVVGDPKQDEFVSLPHKSARDFLAGDETDGLKSAKTMDARLLIHDDEHAHDSLAEACHVNARHAYDRHFKSTLRGFSNRFMAIDNGTKFAVSHAVHHLLKSETPRGFTFAYEHYTSLQSQILRVQAQGPETWVVAAMKEATAVLAAVDDVPLSDSSKVRERVEFMRDFIRMDANEHGMITCPRGTFTTCVESRLVSRDEEEEDVVAPVKRRKSLTRKKSSTTTPTTPVISTNDDDTFHHYKRQVERLRFDDGGKFFKCVRSERPAPGGSLLMSLRGHLDGVTSAVFSNEMKHIVTGSADKTAKMWSVETGKEVFTLKGHTERVTSVAFSNDSKYVLTGSWDHTAKLWSAETGKHIFTLRKHSDAVYSVAFSNDSKYIVTGSNDKTAIVWSAETGTVVKTLKGHSKEVNSVTFSNDAKHIVTGSADKTAKMWSVELGCDVMTLTGHSDYVYSVAFSNDAKYIVTGSKDFTAKLWSVATKKEVKTFKGHSSDVRSVAFSNDIKYIVTGSYDGTAKLWSIENGDEVKTLTGHSDIMNSVSFSNDDSYVVTASQDSTAKVWSVESGKDVRTFEGHRQRVTCVTFSNDMKYVATGSVDRTAKVLSVETGKEVCALKGHSRYVISVAFSNDAKWVVTGSYDDTAKVWSIETGMQVRTLKGHSGPVTSLAVSYDTKYILTGSSDKTAKLWSVKTGKEVRTLKGHLGTVNFVAFSDDVKYVVTGSADKRARIWSVETGKEEFTLIGHTKGVSSVAFSNDSKYVLTGSWDHTAKLWSAETGALVKTLKGHSEEVKFVGLSSDMKYVVTGTQDSNVKVWSIEAGHQVEIDPYSIERRSGVAINSPRIESVPFEIQSEKNFFCGKHVVCTTLKGNVSLLVKESFGG